jgi:uncharacterized membrane protein YraQ (UPF0718 family)
MDLVWQYAKDTVLYVLGTLAHNAPALILGILVASAIRVYIDPDRMRNWLMKRSSVSVPATVVFGAFTPFCACGTMAVVLAMLATALPWGPVMAFLTSSPLMSPEGFILISGIISPAFAIALAVASVVIGLGSGYGTHLIEKKTHFLDNQLRFDGKAAPASADCACSAADSAAEGNSRERNTETAKADGQSCCGASPLKRAPEQSCCGAPPLRRVPEQSCCGAPPLKRAPVQSCCGAGALRPVAVQSCCGAPPAVPAASSQPCCAAAVGQARKGRSLREFMKTYNVDKLLKAVFDLGVKKILPYFAIFAGIGYLINRFIPSTWITALFGEHNIFAVPLAAIVGLPLYVNGDSAIPLIQSLMQSGVGAGAMLAFMITGPGTSAGVLAGIATIMKKKAIALYIAFLLVGAILLGYAYDLVLAVF